MSDCARQTSPPLERAHPLTQSENERATSAQSALTTESTAQSAPAISAAIPAANSQLDQSTQQNPKLMTSLFGHYAEPAKSAIQSHAIPSSIRTRVESATGADLSGVLAHTGPAASQRASEHGASAFALGSDIYFGEGKYQPGTPAGDWLIAHELTHTIQQKSVGRIGLQAHTEVGPAYDASEAEADRVADCAMNGHRYPLALTPTPTAKIQRFAPDGHRRAGAEGLKGSFSAEEIGLIYQSNWERDFSQASPLIADLVLSWKQVKDSYIKNKGQITPDLNNQFRNSLWAVLDMNTEITDESMGGYYPWQHMDYPDKKSAKKLERENKDKTNGMPAYLDQNVRYVMELMVRSVDQYWNAEGRKDHPISSWHFVSDDILHPKNRGAGNPNISRDIIGTEATNHAKSIGTQSSPLARDNQGNPLMKGSAESLGRAMHCIEDFFSHTNWIDLAHKVKNNQKINPTDLQSGTFGLADKCHALGHKLVSLSDSLLADFDILLRSFNRNSEYKPNIIERASLALDLAPLHTNSMTPLGEMSDLFISATLLENDVRQGFLSLDSIFCNRSVLEKIRHKGQMLIEEGDKESPSGGHGKMAKDQPEQGKDFSTAYTLAVRADELIIAPLRRAMMSQDSDQGAQILAQQLAVARNVLAPPSPQHPLLSLVK